MRRISLALALVGAVTAAGCSGGAKSSDSGSGKGVQDGTITVTVQNGQALNGAPANPSLAITGGYVTSAPAGIDCGIAPHATCSAQFPAGTTVVLTATAAGTDPAFNLPFQFLGWAGDCQGDGTCSLEGNADKYVLTMFAGQRTGHPNWTDGAVHGPKYADFVNGVPGALACTSCHGASLQGAGLAVSCSACHVWPLPTPPVSLGLNVNVTSAAIDSATKVLTLNFTVKDDQGSSIALPTGGRFALARVDSDATGTLPYAVLTPAAATGNPSTINFPAISTTAAPTTLVQNALGDYTYTSPALNRVDTAKLSSTHTIWIQVSNGSASTLGKAFRAVNQEFNFVPDASGAAGKREIVSVAGCNACHAGFKPEGNVASFHSSGRIAGPFCNICHNQARTTERTNSDPGTAPAGTPIAASSVFIHRIHAAKEMLLKVTTGTQTVGWQYGAPGAAMTQCTVAAPCTCTVTNACAPTVYDGLGEATYPQDLRNCGICHPNTAQGNQWKTRPSRAACGSCHDTVDFTIHNTGGTPAVEADCTNCHSAADVAAAHVPVVAKDPNNILDTPTGGNSRTNAADIAAVGALPPGASRITYDLKSVAAVADANGVLRPTLTFRFLKDGAPVVFNAPGGELMTGFVGSSQAYCAYSVPQDGIAAPVDFNVAGGVSIKAIRNGTGAGSMADGTGADAGYYVVTLTGQRVLPSSAILTCGLGYAYDLPANQPITQIDLAAYPYNTTTKSGGLIVPIANAWKTANGYAPRRAIVSNDKCNACHGFLGVAPNFHVGQRNDGPTCAFCHNTNRVNSGWAVNSKDVIHGIHAARMRTTPFTWEATAGAMFWEVAYPGQLNNCQQCHEAGTYDFTAPASAAALGSLLPSTVATGTISASAGTSPYVTLGVSYGSGFSYAQATGAITPAAGTTLVISPITAACFSCHDSTTAVAHMEQNLGQIYQPRSNGLVTLNETCLDCHGAGKMMPIGDVH
ncbi:OmcA/MtrC family decaheme c-type cytochrome [Anaeromyxobacter oryzae]|uniref:Outer membrane cytochrome MtrC/MtrF-like domain-containing protein n=1 Tax=Anaeromyxobacter oryzae TaxID=2918170 RepID=A0ABM7X0K4_9BACT|nr:OmcA/MtrC family decaheme c-type cytochrome [Anaeromyxobacter oryzae]BDG05238.1 hypothetical protein AMOR_42340 [Anaeromyxobacter oryzae]